MLSRLIQKISSVTLIQVLTVAVTLLSAATLLLGCQAVKEKRPLLASLNLSSVVELQEASLTLKGLKGEELNREAQRFALSLKNEIASIQKECECTLLVSSAIVGEHDLPDYTDTLVTRLKLDPRVKEYARGLMQKTLSADKRNLPS